MASTRKIIDILKLPPLNCYGFDVTSEVANYTRDGVMIHKTSPCFDSWSVMLIKPYMKRAEFVDIRGNITDEFWGDENDFNLWFLGKAVRDEQFFVIGFYRKGHEVITGRVVKCKIWLDAWDKYQEFYQADDMAWHIT